MGLGLRLVRLRVRVIVQVELGFRQEAPSKRSPMMPTKVIVTSKMLHNSGYPLYFLPQRVICRARPS